MNICKNKKYLTWLAAFAVPLLYLFIYTPLGMDTTDFGYFYGYAWRILEGQMPYRDFTYIKPALPLYWHAFWMWLAPEKWEILAGKAGFVVTILATSWLGALYLRKIFDFREAGLSLPLLALSGFIFGIHSFPHMPWHTADGIFFSSACLFLAAYSYPLWAGVCAACAMLCKQSFLLVPLAAAIFIYLYTGRKKPAIIFILAWLGSLGAAFAWIHMQGAWSEFRAMTTGQLDIREALDAGILIYLRQNWLLPIAAIIPWLACRFWHKTLAGIFLPAYCYLFLLLIWFAVEVFSQQKWVGYGTSWPTLFLLLASACALFPDIFLMRFSRLGHCPWPQLATSVAVLAAIVAAWSAAISGGYKIPAMFAVPGLFGFYIIHLRLGGSCLKLEWATVLCGLVIFALAWHYPYTFPERPLKYSQLKYDAGHVYEKASGVKVDQDMLDRLGELKYLRGKYGPAYKTMPGFTLSYYLNGDYPPYGSDWLIDWEINGDADKFYQDLLDKKLTVFMERDQLDTKQADHYARAAYTVPQLVRNNWRIVDETPHFVIFQAPESLLEKE